MCVLSAVLPVDTLCSSLVHEVPFACDVVTLMCPFTLWLIGGKEPIIFIYHVMSLFDHLVHVIDHLCVFFTAALYQCFLSKVDINLSMTKHNLDFEMSAWTGSSRFDRWCVLPTDVIFFKSSHFLVYSNLYINNGQSTSFGNICRSLQISPRQQTNIGVGMNQTVQSCQQVSNEVRKLLCQYV